jgi:hypothetical protein
MMAGSDSFRRVELDVNRRVGNKVAMRFAAVASDNDSWIDHVRRNFAGSTGRSPIARSARPPSTPWRNKSRIDSVNAQGLFLDNFSFANVTTLTNTAGVVYVPATGQLYRAATMRRSNGTGYAVVDPTLDPQDLAGRRPRLHLQQHLQLRHPRAGAEDREEPEHSAFG